MIREVNVLMRRVPPARLGAVQHGGLYVRVTSPDTGLRLATVLPLEAARKLHAQLAEVLDDTREVKR